MLLLIIGVQLVVYHFIIDNYLVRSKLLMIFKEPTRCNFGSIEEKNKPTKCTN